MRKCRTVASSDGLIVEGGKGTPLMELEGATESASLAATAAPHGGDDGRTDDGRTDDVSSVNHRVSWRPLIEGHGSK